MRVPGRLAAALSSTMKWLPTAPLGLRKRASSCAGGRPANWASVSANSALMAATCRAENSRVCQTTGVGAAAALLAQPLEQAVRALKEIGHGCGWA
jgi:hypothetical protein